MGSCREERGTGCGRWDVEAGDDPRGLRCPPRLIYRGALHRPGGVSGGGKGNQGSIREDGPEGPVWPQSVSSHAHLMLCSQSFLIALPSSRWDLKLDSKQRGGQGGDPALNP